MAMDVPHAEQLLGVHEDPDALLAEMLGRPLVGECGVGITRPFSFVLSTR